MQTDCLSLQDAIKDRDQFEDFQCQICYSIALTPAECSGPCHKKFCTKCVSDWKMTCDRCPLKCSQKAFFVKTIDPPAVHFKCPFSPSMCPTVITSIQKFYGHHEECQFISQEQKKKKLLKLQGKCFKEHNLQFFLGTYEEMCESTCADCKEVKLCRSICRKCNQLYCVFCRPPKCSKKSCPQGHKFNYQKWSQIGYICDLCGVSTSITNNGVYDDSLCNFGLCESCHSKLPNQSEVSEIISKKSHQCSQGHDLEVKISQEETKNCFNCEKTKYCPRICNACDQSYCLECRMGIVLEAKICLNGHQLIKRENESEKVCIKCMAVSSTYFIDIQCKFTLCQSCFDYENRILDNKNRFIEQISCEKGHQLKFYSGESECIEYCFGCHKNSVIKLFCDYCPIGERTYCCSCRPLKEQSNKVFCYFGHRLQEWKSDETLHCNKCVKNETDFHKCLKCNYFVCNECFSEEMDEE